MSSDGAVRYEVISSRPWGDTQKTVDYLLGIEPDTIRPTLARLPSKEEYLESIFSPNNTPSPLRSPPAASPRPQATPTRHSNTAK